jgi:hypothetical protein
MNKHTNICSKPIGEKSLLYLESEKYSTHTFFGEKPAVPVTQSFF